MNIIGANDAFSVFDMPGGAYIESYLPISLFRDIGYEAYFSDGNVYINNTETSSPTTVAQESAEIAESAHTSNPFGAPLLNFFAGDPDGWEVYSTQTHNSNAFYAHITGDPRTGFVAIRHHNPFGTPFAVARAFYWVNGQVITKELGNIDGLLSSSSIAFTQAGRLIQVYKSLFKERRKSGIHSF